MKLLSIAEPTIIDFALKLEQAILDGYKLSITTDHAPVVMGWLYSATLVKEDVVAESVNVEIVKQETKPAGKSRK